LTAAETFREFIMIQSHWTCGRRGRGSGSLA